MSAESTRPAAPPAETAPGAEGAAVQEPPKKDGGKDGKQDEQSEQSESLVRSSYLPVNKLKDAPSASEYEGRSPEEFTGEKGAGVGESLSKGVHKIKDTLTPGHKHSDSKP